MKKGFVTAGKNARTSADTISGLLGFLHDSFDCVFFRGFGWSTLRSQTGTPIFTTCHHEGTHDTYGSKCYILLSSLRAWSLAPALHHLYFFCGFDVNGNGCRPRDYSHASMCCGIRSFVCRILGWDLVLTTVWFFGHRDRASGIITEGIPHVAGVFRLLFTRIALLNICLLYSAFHELYLSQRFMSTVKCVI